MQIVFAVGLIITVFWIVFWLVQKFLVQRPCSNDARDLRRTLENGARTLGGSDYLRLYPPVESIDERPHAECG